MRRIAVLLAIFPWSASWADQNKPKPTAMDQLRFVQTRSAQADGAHSSEDGAEGSADAFEQGNLGKVAYAKEGGVVTGVSGVPSAPLANDWPMPPIPDTGFGKNHTPYQPHLDLARWLGDGSIVLFRWAGITAAIGTAFLATGLALGPLGIPLILLGLATLAFSQFLSSASVSVGLQARNVGSEIRKGFRQGIQADIVADCADQARLQLIPMDQCSPSETVSVPGRVVGLTYKSLNAVTVVMACKDDWEKFCKGEGKNASRVIRCMKAHEDQVSASCRAQLPTDPVPVTLN